MSACVESDLKGAFAELFKAASSDCASAAMRSTLQRTLCWLQGLAVSYSQVPFSYGPEWLLWAVSEVRKDRSFRRVVESLITEATGFLTATALMTGFAIAAFVCVPAYEDRTRHIDARQIFRRLFLWLDGFTASCSLMTMACCLYLLTQLNRAKDDTDLLYAAAHVSFLLAFIAVSLLLPLLMYGVCDMPLWHVPRAVGICMLFCPHFGDDCWSCVVFHLQHEGVVGI